MTENEEIQKRIEQLRAKLLDLSTANKMLSYKHPKAGCLRVVDELPSEIFKKLFAGASLDFAPVPLPTKADLAEWSNNQQSPLTAEKWAAHIGIDTSYDLPIQSDDFDVEGKHSDNKLQTLHYPDDLDSRLRKIQSAARSAIEESGANMLYFSFGFLEWQEASTSKSHQAPIILMPVNLNKVVKTGQQKLNISWSGDEIQVNLTLEKKLAEFGVILPEITENFSAEEFFREISLRIRTKPSWRVRRYLTLGLFDFGKIVLYNDLDPKNWPPNSPLTSRPIVRKLLAGTEAGASLVSGKSDRDSENSQKHDIELPLVDRADSSQCAAISEVLAGKDLVLEGPPGTGKSQTITNMIACALAQGKSVLFIAEKLEALEVVRRRMRELGLGSFCLELHSSKTKKGSLLEDINERLLSEQQFKSSKPNDALTALISRRNSIQTYLGIIGKRAFNLNISVYQLLMRAGKQRRKLEEKTGDFDSVSLSESLARDLDVNGLYDAKSRIRAIEESHRDLSVVAEPSNHPWRGVSSAAVLPTDAKRLAQMAQEWGKSAEELEVYSASVWSQFDKSKIEALLANISVLKIAYALAHESEAQLSAFEAALGYNFPRNSEGVVLAIKLLECIKKAPLESGLPVPQFCFVNDSSAIIARALSLLEILNEVKGVVQESFSSSAFNLNLSDCEDLSDVITKTGFFARFSTRYLTAKSEWERISRPKVANISRSQIASLLESLKKYIEASRELSSEKFSQISELIEANDLSQLAYLKAASEWIADFRKHINVPFDLEGVLKRDIKTACSRIDFSNLAEVLQFISTTKSASLWQSVIKAEPFDQFSLALPSAAVDHFDWDLLRDKAHSYLNALARFQKAEEAFFSLSKLNPELWFSGSDATNLRAVRSRSLEAAGAPEALASWLIFDQSLRATRNQIEEPMIAEALAGRISFDGLEDSFLFVLYNTLARLAFTENEALLSFSRQNLDRLRAEYRALDAEVMEARRVEIARKLFERKPLAGFQSPVKSKLSEFALIKHELSLKKSRTPIRQLMRRAGKSMQMLKPCFMMGPISAAQYIPGGHLNFDLIIIDEASQMRPEDAMGALARGGQTLIVGDPKQLPPTSFFDRAMLVADTEDEEVTIAEESKSILDLGASLFDTLMLRYHYRSRHESLIAFSNHNFYRNELIVFPSPKGQSEELGIGWTFVQDGAASKGVNAAEARAVARFVQEFVKSQTGRTIGVVAMNMKQAERIADEIESLKSADAEFRDRIAELDESASGEDFFVKNLERVQGDQRDVIVISMTYGPVEVGGKTPQNFGPINQDSGWRRLNVLFTRAKERMEVFSSMKYTDIVPKDGSDSGPAALKGFLEYAETGRLGVQTTLTQEPTNEFEDAIQEGLEALGYQCVPQLGVGFYRLDIAVRDPNNPSHYIAAVECDGATYHSTRSARDRDRIRQEILEGLGWNVLRIWSTDWFRDPNAELARIDGELKKLLQRASSPKRRIELSVPRVELVEKQIELPDIPTSVRSAPVQSELDFPPRFVGYVRADKPIEAKRSSGLISTDQARQILIDLRETKLRPAFPNSEMARGFLRKSMLDELLRKRPTDMEGFREMVSLALRENTEAEQVKAFGEEVFDVLARVR